MTLNRKKSTRFFIAFSAGCTAAVLSVIFLPLKFLPLLTWDVVAITLLLQIWHDILHASTPQTTRILASQDDMDRSLLDIIILLASLASLGAVAILLTSKDSSLIIIGFGLASIVISWLTVHALFTVHYAARYFKIPTGGVVFEGSKQPSFYDFAYLAFTIGMTYQVSDTTFTSSEFRRMALGHALLSFVFGTAIIATTINFVASLSQ